MPIQTQNHPPSNETIRIKRNLVAVITSLVRKSIEEAAIVPYVMEQDKLVDLFLQNSNSFQDFLGKGVLDGQSSFAEKKIVQADILAELDEFKSMDQFDLSFDRMADQEQARNPVFSRLTLLARMFSAYVSNVVAVFEEEYHNFLQRYRQAFQVAGQELHPVELGNDDLADMERAAKTRFVQGEFIGAFAFDRIFNPEVLKEEVLLFPHASYSLGRRMIENAPKDSVFFAELIKFLLRASYISHNLWFDLLAHLIQLAETDPHKFRRCLLVHWIEQDSVFCCNLLRETFESLRWWTSTQRKDAIERALTSIARGEISLMGP